MTNFVFNQIQKAMSLSDYTHTLTQAVSELSDKHSYEGLFHQYKDGDPLPSGKSLRRIVELSRRNFFSRGYLRKLYPSTEELSTTTVGSKCRSNFLAC